MARVIIAVLVFAALFVACGGDDASDGDATAIGGGDTGTATAEATSEGGAGGGGGAAVEGPFALVSNETMSELLSVAVTGVNVNAALCEYAPNDGAPGSEVLAADLFANAAFDEECSLEFDNTGRGDPVDGLANEAFWKGHESGSIGTAQLLFCTGDQFWTVTLYVPADRTEDILAVARGVAETALAAR